jgi:hypothetical protein
MLLHTNNDDIPNFKAGVRYSPALRVQCFYAKIIIINVSCMRCEFLANVKSKLRFCGLWSHSIITHFMTA